MPYAEFEEKEYELSFNIELANGSLGTVWSAGQVLEGVVGYDGVADPEIEHVVWSVLNVPRPKGVVLAPHYWGRGKRPSSRDLNSNPISLILQYKRPEYLFGARAAQWKLWHQPYYRFRRSAKQHQILKRLEGNLGGDAVVRYAAPAFWKRAELEENAWAGKTILNSGFVSPAALAAHKVWTYQAPGTIGRGNPSGKRQEFESMEGLKKALISTSKGEESLVVQRGWIERIAPELSTIAKYRNPTLRKELEVFEENLINAELGLSHRAIRGIFGIAAICTQMAAMDACWYLVPGLVDNQTT